MSQELYTKISEALTARKAWEGRQTTTYQMRRTGLRRKSKPFPGAADMHYPLADSIVEKQKPLLYNQVFNPAKLAAFQSWKPDYAGFVDGVERYFDYKLRRKSNFSAEMLILTDILLETGKAILKVIWDERDNQLLFEALDPLYFIVPAACKDSRQADWGAQVHQYTVDAYKALDNFKRDEETLAAITGKEGDQPKEQEKYRREGVNFPGKDQIIVWEVWERNHADGTYKVKWFSPSAPAVTLRELGGNPYQHGKLPFVEFSVELIEHGYYAPRGLVQRVAPFQMSLTKNWNEKLDCMTYYNRPTYTTDKANTEVNNVRLLPGQIVGGGVRRIEHGAPPISFDQEMNATRMIAESMVGQPDYLSGQALNTSERRTKFEIQQVMSTGDGITTLRAITFALALTQVYELAWALLVELDQDTLFLFAGELGELPAEALAGNYAIAPNGNWESSNKQMQAQLASMLFESLRGDPFTDQGELRLMFLEAVAPQFTKRLYINAETQAADQAEDAALEICALRLGYPMRVKESDNDLLHLQVLQGYFAKQGQTADGHADQAGIIRLVEHGMQHVAAFSKKSPEQFAQWVTSPTSASARMTFPATATPI